MSNYSISFISLGLSISFMVGHVYYAHHYISQSLAHKNKYLLNTTYIIK